MFGYVLLLIIIFFTLGYCWGAYDREEMSDALEKSRKELYEVNHERSELIQRDVLANALVAERDAEIAVLKNQAERCVTLADHQKIRWEIDEIKWVNKIYSHSANRAKYALEGILQHVDDITKALDIKLEP